MAPSEPATRLRQCGTCGECHDGSLDGIDVDLHPTAAKLVERSRAFLTEVQYLTPGHDLEERLNEHYGPGNEHYEEFCRLIKQGLDEGWVATGELDGEKYRRGRVYQINLPSRIDPAYADTSYKIALPSQSNLHMSITAVYFDSQTEYAGQYHKHPYGEINCVIPIDPGFQLEGMPVGTNWRGAGWTSLGPGTHHYPRARGGKGVALFFLPSGRISYEADPSELQPASY